MSWRNFALSQFPANNYRSLSHYSSPNIFIDTEPDILSLTIDSSSEDEDLDSFILFGVFKGHVVGLPHYNGVVNPNDMVMLQRNPDNPYDRNAVKVNNIHGEQVGYIKRDLAAALAPIMDKKLAKIEGIVPYGVTNPYQMRVKLSFWGREENKQVVIDHMKRYNYEPLPLSSLTPVELQKKLVKEKKPLLTSDSDEKCSICLDSLKMPVITRCAHVFCKECICRFIYENQMDAKCPLCRGKLCLEHLQEMSR